MKSDLRNLLENGMVEALSEGEKLSLAGLFDVRVTEYDAYPARNRRGELIQVPAKRMAMVMCRGLRARLESDDESSADLGAIGRSGAITAAELAARVARRNDLTVEAVEGELQRWMDELVSTLLRRESYSFGKLGQFSIRTKMAREGVEPKTGQVIIVPERNIVAFQASAALTRRLNGWPTRPIPSAEIDGLLERYSKPMTTESLRVSLERLGFSRDRERARVADHQPRLLEEFWSWQRKPSPLRWLPASKAPGDWTPVDGIRDPRRNNPAVSLFAVDEELSTGYYFCTHGSADDPWVFREDHSHDLTLSSWLRLELFMYELDLIQGEAWDGRVLQSSDLKRVHRFLEDVGKGHYELDPYLQ